MDDAGSLKRLDALELQELKDVGDPQGTSQKHFSNNYRDNESREQDRGVNERENVVEEVVASANVEINNVALSDFTESQKNITQISDSGGHQMPCSMPSGVTHSARSKVDEASDDTSSSDDYHRYSEINDLLASHCLNASVEINQGGDEGYEHPNIEPVERQRIAAENEAQDLGQTIRRNDYQSLVLRRNYEGRRSLIVVGYFITAVTTAAVVVGIVMLLWHLDLFSAKVPVMSTDSAEHASIAPGTLTVFSDASMRANSFPVHGTTIDPRAATPSDKKRKNFSMVNAGDNVTLSWSLPLKQSVNCYDNHRNPLFNIKNTMVFPKGEYAVLNRFRDSWANSTWFEITLMNATLGDAGSYICSQTDFNVSFTVFVWGKPSPATIDVEGHQLTCNSNSTSLPEDARQPMTYIWFRNLKEFVASSDRSINVTLEKECYYNYSCRGKESNSNLESELSEEVFMHVTSLCSTLSKGTEMTSYTVTFHTTIQGERMDPATLTFASITVFFIATTLSLVVVLIRCRTKMKISDASEGTTIATSSITNTNIGDVNLTQSGE